MIIFIWILSMVIFAFIFEIIRYLYSYKKGKTNKCNSYLSADWEDTVDVDFGSLSIEQNAGEFVSSRTLSMRGSWRLAQNQVFDKWDFSKMEAEEYSKML